MAVPESIRYMDDISVAELNKYVGVSMSWWIVFERERRAVEIKFEILLKNFRWKCAFWSRRKRKVPTFDARRDGKMFARILVRSDLSTDGVQPFVAVSVIKMPVGIDQMLDRIAAKTLQSLG